MFVFDRVQDEGGQQLEPHLKQLNRDMSRDVAPKAIFWAG